MHELTITESILEIALRHSQSRRITDLHLAIGQLSSIIDDSVQFYWDIISQGTLAEGARLHFRRIPTEMVCQECNRRYAPSGGDLACPDCSSPRVKVVAGDEFMLESIEVEN
ncbi:MAG: hydrogenase maturation nickel metallochaperone HypA [Chloroflexota bacterium]|nr:MAG: hydrogenase maturation nickel metallochaperone HypA [Chloroflexota bacterium]